ncbi:unnamed protein product [Gongylonema pulchrum]|uniref:S ribonuclease n=1 Tax=Gongylonema pulchrum TaxID=637853 RepID=A0A183DJW1_9BILA|nr:unnamed protein product [Gongylonema pulchrum]
MSTEDIRDYTERDFERLYEQWEENDADELEEDELPPHKQKAKAPNLDNIMKQAKSPEELMMMSKKGQSVMMFVGIGDVDGKRAEKHYTERWINIWQSSLYNNHINVQVWLNRTNHTFLRLPLEPVLLLR